MNKYYFGSIGNKKLEWLILDDVDELLLISVDPFGCDNSLYLENFFKDNEIYKYLSNEERERLLEVRLFTIDEYEVYKENYDLKTPYKWYLSQDLECINGDNIEKYYTIVNKVNVKNEENYQDTFDIIQIVHEQNGEMIVINTIDRDENECGYDYSFRPVIRIKK